jgi:hypothetical protein
MHQAMSFAMEAGERMSTGGSDQPACYGYLLEEHGLLKVGLFYQFGHSLGNVFRSIVEFNRHAVLCLAAPRAITVIHGVVEAEAFEHPLDLIGIFVFGKNAIHYFASL